jgi:hypothetical protein
LPLACALALCVAEYVMPKPRLFFSHSTTEGSPERAILMGLKEALQDKYEILLDRTALVVGTDWRSTINIWIRTCDAVVMLITPEAITSDFCRYEWDVLSFRRQEDKLLIIPIYHGSTPEELKGKAHQLHEIAAYFNYDSIESVARKVKDKLLAELVCKEHTPNQLFLLAKLFREAVGDERRIERAAGKIKLELGGWDLAADKWLRFAVQLMGVGIGRAWPALRELQDDFTENQERFDDIVELIGFCSWVNMGAVISIRGRCAPDAVRDPLGLTAKQYNTARAYVLSASDRGPRTHWPLAIPSWKFTNYPELRADIEQALFDAVRLDPQKGAAALKRRIETLGQGGDPVFAALRTAGLSADWLDRLCADELFASVNFLILAEKPGDAQVLLLPPDAMLQPPLAGEFEQKVWDDYEEAKDILSFT